MDDTQRIVKCGNLSLHTAGGFFKKKWHSKYLVLYDGSKSGIKRLELFDSEIKFKKQNAAKIIPLVDCVRVVTCQRNKTTYTFEVRTSEQFYLLAAQSFQDMNDWVNCLRLVAFGEATNSKQQSQQGFSALQQQQQATSLPPPNQKRLQQHKQTAKESIDVLLDKRNLPSNQMVVGNPAGLQQQPAKVTTASQAMSAASSALAKTRQRQPSLLGSCKPQPPTDSPFIQQKQKQQQQQQLTSEGATNPSQADSQTLNAIGGQIDTLTPTVRGQLIGAGNQLRLPATKTSNNCNDQQQQQPTPSRQVNQRTSQSGGNNKVIQKMANTIQATLDEEEENMLYCSIEDNPSEHNYRVKVIESELSLRCQLKCYQLTTPNTVSQQYDQIGNFKPGSGAYCQQKNAGPLANTGAPVIFYQLIIGPQELTLLNDYAVGGSQSANKQQQGLWSWPYQCIRRYGFDKDNCFMFEAGRKCTSGPGQFIVQTPKAYSIYQDVVKFVNELRCVSGSADGQTVSQQPAQPATGAVSSDVTAPTVTQIPVSWAPAESMDSKRQFFDSLRQIGTNQSKQQQQHQPQSNDDQLKTTIASSDSSSNCSTLSNSPDARRSHFLPPHNLSLHHHHLPLHQHQRQHFMHRNPATIPEQCENTSSSSISSSASSTSSSTRAKRSSLATDDGDHHSNIDASSLKRPNSSDVTSEETDESGYEQGDDSVDSSSSRRRSLAAELKNRNSISSSSSSSTSSSSGAGSSTNTTLTAAADAAAPPLYSVIQRPRPASRDHSEPDRQQQHTSSSPPPLSRRWPPQKPTPEMKQRHDPTSTTMRTSNTEKLLSRLMADKPTAATAAARHEQDFEANLIRDVYSEITKLHATFAVTPFSE